MRLHITNGDATAELLRAAEIDEQILCWRDLLHDGPLALNAEGHRRGRAKYLAELVSQTTTDEVTTEQIAQDFIERDQILSELTKFDEIVLWFEHDLYDQLQLIEICYLLKQQRIAVPNLPIFIVTIDQHSEHPFFHGLGELTPEQLLALLPDKRIVSDRQLDALADIWLPLTAPTPDKLAEAAQQTFPGWPFMTTALRRFCCEFPALETGLTLTQTYLMLSLLRAPDELPGLAFRLQRLQQSGRIKDAEQRYYQVLTEGASFRRLFNQLQHLEAAPFMGDLSVKLELLRLCEADLPYVEYKHERYSLTKAGREALQGMRRWYDDNNYQIWRGGVELSEQNVWCWNQATERFVKL